MLSNSSPDTKTIMEYAQGAAEAHNCTELTSVHILLGMLKMENCSASVIMMELELKPRILRQALTELNGEIQNYTRTQSTLPYAPTLMIALQNSKDIAKEMGHTTLRSTHLLLGIISIDDDASSLLLKHGVTEGAVRTEMARYNWTPPATGVSSNDRRCISRATIESEPKGSRPGIAPNAYVHPTAVIIGNVRIGQNVFVGPNAVIRADEPGADGTVQPVIIGEGCNVQDGVVIHAVGGARVDVLPWTSIAHNAVVHGPCRVGPRAFVGFSSVVYGAEVGENSVILHGAVVDHCDIPSGKVVPSGRAIAANDDANTLDDVTEELTAFTKKVSDVNNYLAKAMPNRVRG